MIRFLLVLLLSSLILAFQWDSPLPADDSTVGKAPDVVEVLADPTVCSDHTLTIYADDGDTTGTLYLAGYPTGEPYLIPLQVDQVVLAVWNSFSGWRLCVLSLVEATAILGELDDVKDLMEAASSAPVTWGFDDGGTYVIRIQKSAEACDVIVWRWLDFGTNLPTVTRQQMSILSGAMGDATTSCTLMRSGSNLGDGPPQSPALIDPNHQIIPEIPF